MGWGASQGTAKWYGPLRQSATALARRPVVFCHRGPLLPSSTPPPGLSLTLQCAGDKEVG